MHIRMAGPISMMKSLKVTPLSAKAASAGSGFFEIASGESADPIMMLGGSPIMVAAPPMFEKSTSAMSSGMGLKSSTLANWMVTGVSKSIVVTLSKNADRTAVTRHKMTVRVHTSPPLRL